MSWGLLEALDIVLPNNALQPTRSWARCDFKRQFAVAYVSDLVRGDLNGDGAEDVAVFYAIEGIMRSQLSIPYIAIFVRNNGKSVFKAERSNGGRNRSTGEKMFSPIRIEHGEILCDTLAVDSDNRYTIPGKADLRLSDSKIVERNSR